LKYAFIIRDATANEKDLVSELDMVNTFGNE